MSDPLATHLQDHLAGAMHAVEVLESLKDVYGQPLESWPKIFLPKLTKIAKH
jgi:hypothetical protein